MTGRRALAGLAAGLLLPGAPARALDDAAAARALFADTEDGRRGASMACSAVAPWQDGLSVVVVPDDGALRIALMRDGADGTPETVAGPVSIDPVTIDPLWSCLLDIDRLAPLGGRPVIAVRLHNAYTSTGRSTATEALHLLLRDGPTLRLVFSGLVAAAHSEVAERGRRISWQRRWVVVRTGRGRDGMPNLEVRDRRTNAVVSRHRWTGAAYDPPVFDRTLPLGPG